MSLGGTHKAKNRLPLPVTYFRRVFLAKFGFLGGGVENDDFRGFSGFSGVFGTPPDRGNPAKRDFPPDPVSEGL